MTSQKLFSEVYKGKKVFITGHTGFKGAWITQWLLDLGAEIAGYSLYLPSEPSLFELLNLKNKIKIDYREDILNYNILLNSLEKFQPDFVFHLAAQSIVSESYLNPRFTFQTNLMGMVNILDALKNVPSVKAGVFITSDKCYENVEWEYGYKETDKLGGKDPYSASKACAEIAFSSYVRSFFNLSDSFFATTRAGNVIGGGDWAKDRIVPDCMDAWSRNSVVSIRNPMSTRPWQHVLEPLSGYLWLGANLLLRKENLHGESFNFGPTPETNYSVEVLISLLRKGWETSIIGVEKSNIFENIKEAGLLKLCCDKALSKLNWTPTLCFNETAEMTTDWYQNYYKCKGNIEEYTSQQIRKYSDISFERKKAWII
jgi:CDP-glucose 4,6-dehydratase